MCVNDVYMNCHLQISFDHYNKFTIHETMHLLYLVDVALHQGELFVRFCAFKTVVSMLHVILCWLEKNVRVPLEGTAFDTIVALPLKNKYVKYRRLH